MRFYSNTILIRRFRSIDSQSGGVAVVLVIWVMVMLVALVGEFSYSMRTEIKITRNFKEEEEAYQLALAGIEQAKMELLSLADLRGIYRDPEGNLVLEAREEDAEEEEEETGQIDREVEMGNGKFSYTIEDEDGKLNINTATEAQLKNIFLESGVSIDDTDIIVDSILDWRDANDLHRLNGAEEDYYRSLDPPYSCKDGKFSTVEELLLVKGITPEIFYGSETENVKAGESAEDEEGVYRGVAKYFTVFGANVININTATAFVLEAVFGTETADRILLQRENGPLYRPFPRSKIDSQYFTITSTGMNRDGSIKRTVKVTVMRQAGDIVTLYWNDNYVG